MNVKLKWVIAVAALIFFSISATLFFTYVFSPKLAYIDNGRIFTEVDMIVKANANLKAAQDDETQKIAKIESELGKLQALMQYNDKDDSLKQQYASLVEMYRTQTQDSQRILSEKESSMLQPAINKVNELIAEYGRQHRYDFIFGATASGNIVYGNAGNDITNMVIEFINIYQNNNKL